MLMCMQSRVQWVSPDCKRHTFLLKHIHQFVLINISHQIMNYSTLGAPQREVYFMGLIDMLTQYDTKKKAAHAAKAVKHGVRHQGPVSKCCLEIFVPVK